MPARAASLPISNELHGLSSAGAYIDIQPSLSLREPRCEPILPLLLGANLRVVDCAGPADHQFGNVDPPQYAAHAGAEAGFTLHASARTPRNAPWQSDSELPQMRAGSGVFV